MVQRKEESPQLSARRVWGDEIPIYAAIFQAANCTGGNLCRRAFVEDEISNDEERPLARKILSFLYVSLFTPFR